MNISYFIYLFINGWTSGLFPPLGYYAKYCYEHLCTSSTWIYVFISLECMYLGNETVKLQYVVILFNSLRNCQTVFQSGYTILLIYSWLQSMKLPISPHPQPKLVIARLFFLLQSCLWVWSGTSLQFEVHFLHDKWRWASFHVLIGPKGVLYFCNRFYKFKIYLLQ